MQHTPLVQVRNRVAAGQPLPFNVYDRDATLLLARGQVVHSHEQLDALFERGTLVDLQELRATDAATVRPAPPRRDIPRLWQRTMSDIGATLRDARAPGFRQAVDEAAAPVRALIAQDPDLAVFQILRQEHAPWSDYGCNHAVRTAIVTQLVSGLLGWSDDDRTRAFKAALTMNLSIIELQGRMAEQTTPPTDAQRAEIDAHPVASRHLLELAGIDDDVWLDAVEQHHERRGGGGYPAGLATPTELATLLQRTDDYTARLSGTASREAMSADQAGREIFMQEPGHPVCAALIKAFGVYPPGCFVALASGETGIVVRRGSTVMTPIVAALTNSYGTPLATPMRRDTMLPLHAIVGVVPAGRMRLHYDAGDVAALAS